MTERWWTGSAWSDQTRPVSPTSFPPPPSNPTFYGSTPGGFAPSASTPYYGSKPDSYLVWSILATLFCCLPFGIAGIVQSAKVDGLWSSGDHAGAMRASEQAKKWCVVSAAVGVGFGVLWFLFAMASSAGSGY